MRFSVAIVLGLVLADNLPVSAQPPYQAVLYNGASASQEQRLLAMTLAGIVNRDSARLYLLNAQETWNY